MVYTTDFTAAFNLNTPLSADHPQYLKQFSNTVRIKRDSAKAALLPDILRGNYESCESCYHSFIEKKITSYWTTGVYCVDRYLMITF